MRVAFPRNPGCALRSAEGSSESSGCGTVRVGTPEAREVRGAGKVRAAGSRGAGEVGVVRGAVGEVRVLRDRPPRVGAPEVRELEFETRAIDAREVGVVEVRVAAVDVRVSAAPGYRGPRRIVVAPVGSPPPSSSSS